MRLMRAILYFLLPVKTRGLLILMISVDGQLARNVASNYFTVTCGGCATSSKSSLISAAGQTERRLDVFSCTGMLQTLVCISVRSHGHATLKGFWLPAKIFRAQQIFMTPFMVRKRSVYLRTFSSNRALPNKPKKPVYAWPLHWNNQHDQKSHISLMSPDVKEIKKRTNGSFRLSLICISEMTSRDVKISKVNILKDLNTNISNLHTLSTYHSHLIP